MINFFLIFFFSLIHFKILKASEININSIITLDNNIPKECGLNFKITNNNINTKISIKKKEDKSTFTHFSSESKNIEIKQANIISPSVNLLVLLKKKNKNKKKFEIENATDLDETNIFFQEILISGGELIINDSKFQITGPIDSKVRLEYLFCTGEMFLPNYEQNQ